MKTIIDKIEQFNELDWEHFFGEPDKKITQAAAPSSVATLIVWAAEEAGYPCLTFGGNIYLYNGKNYEKGSLRDLVYTGLKRIGFPLAFVNDSEFIKKVEKNIQVASKSHQDSIEMNPRGLNFLDGSLMITRKGTEFIPHSPKRVFTYALPFMYKGERKASKVWTKFIEQIIPEQEYRTYTLASLANALAGDPLYAQRMLLLMGVGASGKSTLIDAVSAAIGKGNVCNVDDLKNVTKDDSRFRIDLANHILCVCGDASGNIGNKDVLKQIISKEELAGRRLYKEVEYFTPRASLIVASNEIGFTHTLSDSGISRRLDIIEFREAIAEADRDPHIGEKLGAPNEMREMILDMVSALITMQNENDGKMVRPSQLTATLDKLRKEGDSFLSWLHEAGLQPIGEQGVGTIWLLQKEMRDMFNQYRLDNGNGTISTGKAKQKARDHGCLEEKGRMNQEKYCFKVVDSEAYDAMYHKVIYDSTTGPTP